jgi:hypothetical protein
MPFASALPFSSYRTKEEIMFRTNHILLAAAMLTVASAAGSIAFAQQDQPRSLERSGGSGMMHEGGGMMQGGSGMMGGHGMMDGMMGGGMQGMDCRSMMQGQAESSSGSADDHSKEMMERCRSMMGQMPSTGSSSPPAAPEKKD